MSYLIADGTKDEPSDFSLVQKVLGGNQDAFAEIVSRYQRKIFGIVYHHLGPGQDVEDLAQEAFLKIYNGLGSFDGSKPFAPWAYRIAVNCCLDDLRKRRLRRSIRFSELTPGEEAQTRKMLQSYQGSELSEEDLRHSGEILQKILAELQDKDRMAFVLREVEGMEYEEIAGLMKSSENSIRIRVFRARKKLRELYRRVSEGRGVPRGGKRV